MYLETTSSKAVKVVAALGGPTLDEQDIALANDLEGGRLLLEWLAKQLPGTLDAGDDGDGDWDRQANVALRDIALEKDEVLILKQASETKSIRDDKHTSAMDGYKPPSRLRTHAKYIGKENDLVQRETELLKSKISCTKMASRELSQSIKTLQRAVYDLGSKTRQSEERLSEVSFNVDTTVASTKKSAQELLVTLGYSARNGDVLGTVLDESNGMDFAQKSLVDMKNKIASATLNLREGMEALTTLRQQEAAKIDNLQSETLRLSQSFQSSRRGASEVIDLDKELLDICLALESEESGEAADGVPNGDVLKDILLELDEKKDSDDILVDSASLGVEEILRSAWARDQAATLRMEGAVLDEALNSLGEILRPLQDLQSSLSRLATCVQEAEAILEAFGEELGDIVLEHAVDRNEEGEGNQPPDENVVMERELTRVLTEYQDIRPCDAPPLLLLTREDILTELRGLNSRLATVESSEKQTVEGLIHKPLHPILPNVYANSPHNDSPAFAFPAHVQELETRARKRAAELQSLANSLEGEVRETFAKESSAKRLDAFIEKWTVT